MRLLIFSVFLSVLNLGRAQTQIQQNVGNTNSNANQIQQIQQIQNIMRGNTLSSAQWEEIRRMTQNMTGGSNNTSTGVSNSTRGQNFNVGNPGRAQTQIQQNVGNTNSNANQIQQIQQIQNIMSGNTLSSAQWEEIRRMTQNMTGGSDNTSTGVSNSTIRGQNFNVGNPDRGNIRRPCRSLDHSCIRRFLSEHSICKKTFGSVPDPFYRKRVILYLPRINVTLTLYDIKLRGLNARIEDFYVNRDTDKVVLTLEYRRLKMESKNAYYRIHRRAREPIVVKTSFNVTYQSLVLTTIIPEIYKLDLDRSVVFAYLNDPITNYNFGRRLTRSRDREVQANYAAFLLNNRANIGEILLTESPFYPIVYIQKQLCDFGLDVL